VVHRSDPGRPSRPRSRRSSPPDVGSALLQPLDPGPADLTPTRARVWIREIPQRPPRRPGVWIGGYRVCALDVVAAVLGIVLLVVIFWPGLRH
jgi:hypothetical protein